MVDICEEKAKHFLCAHVHDHLRKLRGEGKAASEMMSSLEPAELEASGLEHLQFWAELYATAPPKPAPTPPPGDSKHVEPHLPFVLFPPESE